MTDDQLPPSDSFEPDMPEESFAEEGDVTPAAPVAKKRGSLFGFGKKKAAVKAAPTASEDDLGFEDDSVFAEGAEAEIADESWEEFDEEGGAEVAAAAAKKAKSKNFNRMIIVGAVVIGGGIVFLNMSGGGGNPGAIAPPTQVDHRVPTETASANMSARDIIYGRQADTADEDGSSLDDGKGKSGVLNDPALMKDIEEKTRATEFDDNYYYEQESANAAEGDEDNGKGFGGTAPHEVDDASQPPMPQTAMAPVAQNAQNDTALTPTPAQAPAQAEETASSAGLADAMNPPPAAQQDGDALAPAVADTPKEGMAATADTGVHVDLPEKTAAAGNAATEIKAADTAQEGEMENPFASPPKSGTASTPAAKTTISEPVSAPAVAMASDAKLDALLNRLDQIEAQISTVTARQDDKIGEIQQSLKSLQGQVRNGAVAAAAKTPDLTEEVPEQQAKAAPAPRAHKASKPAAAGKKTSRATRSAAATRTSARYVLKSAQPGWAMVARGDETYTISVGESLPGIGKVLQIYDKEGQWVVQGSKGTISQQPPLTY